MRFFFFCLVAIVAALKKKQHRDYLGVESHLVLDGGLASEFNFSSVDVNKPRLLWIKESNSVFHNVEVDIRLKNLNSEDVFILDTGMDLYQYQGKSASMLEKHQGLRVLKSISAEREGKPKKPQVFSQNDEIDFIIRRFFSYFQVDLKELLPKSPEYDVGTEVSIADVKFLLDKIPDEEKSDKRLMRLSDEYNGKLEFTEVATGQNCKKSLLDSNDVFIFDIGSEIYVWTGKGASIQEKQQAMTYTIEYMKNYGKGAMMPVTSVFEGSGNMDFEGAFS